MINIHLVNDEKFIVEARRRFDNNTQVKNLFVVEENTRNSNEFLNPEENVLFMNFSEPSSSENLYNLCRSHSTVNVLVHLLSPQKAVLVEKLRAQTPVKVFWIFYGIDLYKWLERRGVYKLYDDKERLYSPFHWLKKRIYKSLFPSKNEKVIKNFINNLEFFCFWNLYDFKLLKQHYKTNASFVPFIYSTFGIDEVKLVPKQTKPPKILVNHSGSRSGNHLTILHELKRIKEKLPKESLLVPLSYGNPENISNVDQFCSRVFGSRYQPLLKFLPKDQYDKLLESITIAFFGHRRQEAGANILYLLASGVKVFLREDNNLLSFFKEIGVTIFSFENDFENSMDLEPLDEPLQILNHQVITQKFSEKEVQKMYRNLLR